MTTLSDMWGSDDQAGGTSVEKIRRMLAGKEDYEPEGVWRPVWGQPWATVKKVRKLELPQFTRQREQIQRISRQLAGQAVDGGDVG